MLSVVSVKRKILGLHWKQVILTTFGTTSRESISELFVCRQTVTVYSTAWRMLWAGKISVLRSQISSASSQPISSNVTRTTT